MARRMTKAEAARWEKVRESLSPAEMIRLVVEAGKRLGRWESSGDFARRAMVRDERSVRRWLAGEAVPRVAIERVEKLAEDVRADLLYFSAADAGRGTDPGVAVDAAEAGLGEVAHDAVG